MSLRRRGSPHRTVAALSAVALLVGACGTATPSGSVGASGGASATTSAVASPGGSVATSPSCDSTGAAAAPSASPGVPPGSTAARYADRVFYEAFVRSFDDSNGDGIGDLKGLTAKLDYLNDGNPATTTDLGVTGLWLMPIDASPSYHGYDVTDYRTVQPDYGTNADFKALVAAAHQRGIAVIVDLVINHTSSQHPWFIDSQKPGSAHADWYIWSNTNPGYPGPDGQTVWHEIGGRWYYGLFSDAMPDLNLANPAVTAAVDDIAKYWLVDMGADGFRLDAARHLIEDGQKQVNTPQTLAWLSTFRDAVHADEPGSLLLGEVWDASTAVSKYVDGGSLDLAFEFDLASATVEAIKAGDAGTLTYTLGQVNEKYGQNLAATFLTNHDQPRSAYVLDGDLGKEREAAALLLTERGIPFIYYGEELGLQGTKPDERIRTPLPWSGSGPGYGFTSGTPWETLADGAATTNVATETADPGSLLSTYRDLIRVRSGHPAITAGDLTVVSSDAPAVAAYLRHAPGETLLVVANLGDAPVAGAKLRLASGPLCGGAAASTVWSSAAKADGSGAPTAASPTIGASGGFDGYAPVATLGPHEVDIIRLGS